MKNKILFIQRDSKQCGVADYGRRLYDIIKPHFDINFKEVNNLNDYNEAIEDHDIILYNYHYATLPFITDDVVNKERKHYAIFHEADLNFTPDKIIDTSIRPLFEYNEIDMIGPVPVIGSFGFGFPDKNFPRIAEMVKNEFGSAKLRLNIPFADYGDRDGFLATREADKVISILQGTNIKVEINHNYLNHTELLHFLSCNNINLFLYNQSTGRGLSSAIDYALSVRRPIGVSDSEMFRHLPEEVCVNNSSIKELISKELRPLVDVYKTHSNEALINKFKTILI